jgi:hypothetical protein
MKIINPDLVPLLPMSGIVCNECVAYGFVSEGIIVHYIDRNTAKLIEWADIVILGTK